MVILVVGKIIEQHHIFTTLCDVTRESEKI